MYWCLSSYFLDCEIPYMQTNHPTLPLFQAIRSDFLRNFGHGWWHFQLVPVLFDLSVSIYTALTEPQNKALSATAAAKSLQSGLTLWDPIDGSPPGSPIPGILQARALGWVAISFSNAWKWKVKVKSFSRVPLLATPWTAAYQAPLSMGFSRQEYWSGGPLPSPWQLLVLPLIMDLKAKHMLS